jgi:DNA primase catalytic subunit
VRFDKTFTQESLERDQVLNWVKITEHDKKALAEKKKKKKMKDKKEAAGKKRMTEKLAKVDATIVADKKKMEKNMEQAKKRALNKEKVTRVKGAGGKKGLFCVVLCYVVLYFCSPCVLYELIVGPYRV